MGTLEEYTQTLEATIGAILANEVVTSTESLKVIRDCSKKLDNLSVQLRKDLVAQAKTMTECKTGESQ